MSKSLLNLSDDVLTRLGDTAVAIWSAAEIKGYVKEGYDELCLSTLMLWKRSTTAITDVAGTATYTLPSDLYRVDRITWKNLKIEPWKASEARSRNAYFQVNQGNVTAYVLEADGLGTIRLINVPAANGSNTILEYFRRGATLSADGTLLEIPDYYSDYVVWYALARAYEREGRGQDSEMSQHYQSRYSEGVARVKRRKSQALSSRTGVFGGGDRRPPKLEDPQWPSTYGPTVRMRY